MFLIDDILLAPLKGVVWLGKKINEVVDKEMFDEEGIKGKIMELQIQMEMEKISKEEYDKQEKELLSRLEAVRKAKEGGD